MRKNAISDTFSGAKAILALIDIRTMSTGTLFPGLMNRKRLVCSLKVGAEF